MPPRQQKQTAEQSGTLVDSSVCVTSSPATSGKEVKRMNRSKRNSRSCLVEHRPWLQRNGGFTLVELLVVISIIALLMGLVMYAPGLVRGEAFKLECKTNLRGIGIALQMYASDNGGRFPDVTDPNRAPQEIRQKLLRYVSNEKIFYCPVSGDPYDFCVTNDPKTTLSNKRLDLLSQPNRILLGGESNAGTHKDNMLNVITGDFGVVVISVEEWFISITTPIAVTVRPLRTSGS
jgi:prepilin-type N-terminal cleavage/methylation domain-containing protein